MVKIIEELNCIFFWLRCSKYTSNEQLNLEIKQAIDKLYNLIDNKSQKRIFYYLYY